MLWNFVPIPHIGLELFICEVQVIKNPLAVPITEIKRLQIRNHFASITFELVNYPIDLQSTYLEFLGNLRRLHVLLEVQLGNLMLPIHSFGYRPSIKREIMFDQTSVLLHVDLEVKFT